MRAHHQLRRPRQRWRDAEPPTNHDGSREAAVKVGLVVNHVHKPIGDAELRVHVGEVGGDRAAQALQGGSPGEAASCSWRH